MKHCEWFEVFTVVVLCLFEEADVQHLWDQPLIKKNKLKKQIEKQKDETVDRWKCFSESLIYILRDTNLVNKQFIYFILQQSKT